MTYAAICCENFAKKMARYDFMHDQYTSHSKDQLESLALSFQGVTQKAMRIIWTAYLDEMRLMDTIYEIKTFEKRGLGTD